MRRSHLSDADVLANWRVHESVRARIWEVDPDAVIGPFEACGNEFRFTVRFVGVPVVWFDRLCAIVGHGVRCGAQTGEGDANVFSVPVVRAARYSALTNALSLGGSAFVTAGLGLVAWAGYSSFHS